MRGRGPGFREVLGVREFRALWAAELLSVLGDQLARVALALLVFQRTSSAALTALTYALTFAPAVLGGALLSSLADRFPRRSVLVATDLIRAALAGTMAIPSLPLPALWVLVGLLSMAGGPFKAAQLALLPQVLDGKQYVVGLSLRQITGQSAQLAGFASGGLLLTAVEPHLALGANAATFLTSAALILVGVRRRPAAMASAQTAPAELVPALRGNRQLLPLIVLMCLAGLFVVPEGIAAPYGAALGVGSIGIGLLMAADPLGSVLGAWLVAVINVRPSASSVALLAAGSGIPLLICAPGPGLAISILLWAMSGALSTAYLIQAQAMVVTIVPDHRRGRVMGRIATCLYTSQGVAIVLGGLAAEVVGPFRAVAGAGLLGTVIALCVGVWWRRVARSRRDLVAGSEQSSTAEISHQRSLLAMTDTSSQTNCQRGHHPQARTRPHRSLLATTNTSFQPKPTGQPPTHRSLLATTATSSHELETNPNTHDQRSLLATTATSLHAKPTGQPPTHRSLLATTATSLHELETEHHTHDQRSLLATTNTSFQGLETEHCTDDHRSLLATRATSFHQLETNPNTDDHRSLLATTNTSSHQLETGPNTDDQRSLLATINTSSHWPSDHRTTGREPDQRSLLAMTGTSFQAGWRMMRKAGRFLERFTRHGTVDWELKRPHYGGASG